ncbi:MAG: methylated-DNA--[protein]-cysteine S-methyltransferase [Candidatus Korobacteraceae bacterium]
MPCGTTVSYAKLAEQVGRPAAIRAVGLANGANPIGAVVPCHRVIGANGSLTGYGDGIERNSWLLEHEAGMPTIKRFSVTAGNKRRANGKCGSPSNQ